MVVIIIITGVFVWSGILALMIWNEKFERDVEKNILSKKEILDEQQDLILNGLLEQDKLNFYPDREKFINKTKKERNNVLFVAFLFLILFFASFPLGLWDFITNKSNDIFWLKFGGTCFFSSLAVFIWYAAKYHDKAERIRVEKLYYDNNKNILFLDKDTYFLSGYLGGSYKSKLLYRVIRIVNFGQPNVQRVIYSIKNITSILVKKDHIVLYGEVIMTSFDEEEFNNSYIDYIEFNKVVTFFDEGKSVNMYSKRLEKIEISRGYGGFEKFLIAKQYAGSEELL